MEIKTLENNKTIYVEKITLMREKEEHTIGGLSREGIRRAWESEREMQEMFDKLEG